MVLQSNADLRLLNGPLPVISHRSVPRSHLRSLNCWLFLGWGRQPHVKPPTWRTRSLYLYPLETGWPSYTPIHRVPIFVAFYDMHGLQWDYSFPRSPHGEILICIQGKYVLKYGTSSASCPVPDPSTKVSKLRVSAKNVNLVINFCGRCLVY
jgi:hypothetical protein